MIESEMDVAPWSTCGIKPVIKRRGRLRDAAAATEAGDEIPYLTNRN